MTTSEKVAYLKGLAEGLGIDEESKEGKLLLAIIDILEDLAADVEDLEENALDLSEEIDALSDDLADIEDLFMDEDDDDDEDDDCCCGHRHHGEPLLYEVKCPSCSNEITVDEEVLDLGSISCPNCGEVLEFDFEDIDEDELEDEDDED